MDLKTIRRDIDRLTRAVLSHWRPFLAIHIAVSVLIFTLLMPAFTFLLRLSVTLSGESALSDQDIAFFFLSPGGFVALLLLGSVFSVILFLEHAALLVVARSADGNRGVTVRQVLRFLAGRMAGLFRLALLVLLRVLLNLLPFALAILVIYQWLLTDYDINYYLAEKPDAWRLAVVLGGIVAVACALNLLRLFINWVFCLPLQLFGRRFPARALADSRDAVRGRRSSVAAWLVGWLTLSLLLTLLVSALLSVLGMLLMPVAATSVTALLVALALGSLLAFLLYFSIGFAASAWLSLLIMKLSREAGLEVEVVARPDAARPAPQPLLADRRLLATGLVAGFMVAGLSSWLLIERLQIESATEVMAHRGASAAAPENTLAAVQLAIDAGAHWVEIDVQESADGAVVVIHDSDLKKIGGSDLTVAGATLAELRQVDIGSWFDPAFADQRVPTLEEVLELCRDRIGVNIELKYYGKQKRLEERVAEVVERSGMADQVMFMSLSYAGIQELRRLRPNWRVGLLSSVAIGDLAGLDVDFLALNGRAASRSLIRHAHARGKQVMVWTVNDAVAMASMVGRGADALITDEPALAAEVLEEFSRLEPVERLLIQLADVFDRPGLYREQ